MLRPLVSVISSHIHYGQDFYQQDALFNCQILRLNVSHIHPDPIPAGVTGTITLDTERTPGT